MDEVRTYYPEECAVFRKTNERFGGLSNMAPGYPLCINEHQILTSEALYQSCRYPHLPEVQKTILAQTSPITAKMKSKAHYKATRSDWESVRMPIMRWCLRVKLAQNWQKFGEVLQSTKQMPIVELSPKDKYWAASPTPDGSLVGMNVLGRLLMHLREEMLQDPDRFQMVVPLELPDFKFLGKTIEPVAGGRGPSRIMPSQRREFALAF
jgi:ribA/ribD-fused uncharacterized protein